MPPLRLLIASLLVSSLAAMAEPRGQGQAEAYTIVDDTTGTVLETYNGNRKEQVGSLTSIATAMVVLDWSEAKQADLNQRAVVPDSAVAISSTNGLGLRPGDELSMRDLLYATLMQSDNQAAETLADHVGRALGDPKDPVNFFVTQMNALGRRLGLRNTRFVNPHGLDGLDRFHPYSTAEDMAKLTHYAMDRAAFRFYVSQRERKITINSSAGESSSYLLKNTNELLGEDGVDGVRTGTTRNSGPCIIISAPRSPESVQKGDTHIITPRRIDVVVLGAADRFSVARSLLSRGWQLYDRWAAAGRPAKWSGH